MFGYYKIVSGKATTQKNKDMNEISIEQLILKAESVRLFKNEGYLLAYPKLLKFGETIHEVNEDNICLLAHMAYGWMPTILTLRQEHLGGCIQSANALIQFTESENTIEPHIENMALYINNSVVGASKVLHFLKPDLYPIWDSRVSTALFNNSNNTRKQENYLAYYQYCHGLRATSGIADLVKTLSEKVGYLITSIRAVELILYLIGIEIDNRTS